MREPPEALLRLTPFLGSEPSRDVSSKRRWFSLVGGTAVVLFACLLLLPLVILGAALVYVWVGVLGAVAWAMFVVLDGVWRTALRRRRARG